MAVDDASDPRALKRTRGGRERLLAAAAEVFGTQGLAGASLQLIADRLGVSKPALYHHFRSRDEIVTTLMAPVIDDARAALDRLEGLDPGERPAWASRFYADFLVTHRRVVNMVFFDRAALPGDLASTVDHLADGVATALVPVGTAQAGEIGTTVVYGTAALVTRRQHLDDAALHHVVARAIAVTTGMTAENAGG